MRLTSSKNCTRIGTALYRAIKMMPDCSRLHTEWSSTIVLELLEPALSPRRFWAIEIDSY